LSNFTFNFAQADAVLDDVARINQRINQALDELESNVERSLDAWESEEVKTLYQDTKRRWNQSAMQMNAFLETAQRTLLGVADNYGSTERANAGRWGG
jgi:WXG100 family type VII secretion target